MKKWLIIEIAILTVLLTVAVIICVDLPAISKLEKLPDTPNQNAQLSGTEKPPAEETTQTPDEDPPEEDPPAEDPEEEDEPKYPTWMQVPQDRELSAREAFVYDCKTGEFTFLLGEKEEKIYPASITKLFTAYVALQFLEPEQLITAGDVLNMVGSGSSLAEIEKGDVVTVEQLVEAMLLPSGNDAAHILADAAGRVIAGNQEIGYYTAVETFMTEMNGQARALGAANTHFTNPDGYHDPDHYTTFADLVKITVKVMENPTIMKYANKDQDTVSLASGEKEWKNTNQLVHPESKYYCSIATGLKTGQTPSAGSCLLSSFAYEGGQWIIGVFQCADEFVRFDDTLQLLSKTIKIGEME